MKWQKFDNDIILNYEFNNFKVINYIIPHILLINTYLMLLLIQ